MDYAEIKRECSTNTESVLTLDEWLTYVDSDSELSLYAYPDDKEYDNLRFFRGEGLAVWTKYSKHNNPNDVALFSHRGDYVDILNPSQEIIIKTYSIAQALNAVVRGAGGETFDDKGNTSRTYPFHLYSLERQTMSCARESDGDFHVFKPGAAPVILRGYGFILVKDPVLSILRTLCIDSAEFRKAKVVRDRTGEVFKGYYEVFTHNEITLDNYKQIEQSGFNLWNFNKEYLFVSNNVRNEIFNLNDRSLSLTPGFYGFG